MHNAYTCSLYISNMLSGISESITISSDYIAGHCISHISRRRSTKDPISPYSILLLCRYRYYNGNCNSLSLSSPPLHSLHSPPLSFPHLLIHLFLARVSKSSIFTIKSTLTITKIDFSFH